MTFTLHQLSENEYWFYNQIVTKNGPSVYAVKCDITADESLPGYQDVHKAYLSLFYECDDDAIRLECLKRLIFLNWYMIVEPPSLSGLNDLYEDVKMTACRLLDDYIGESKLDREFVWMLEYYASFSWAFNMFIDTDLLHLPNFLLKNQDAGNSYPRRTLPKGTMDNRGQMGIYWKEFVEIQ